MGASLPTDARAPAPRKKLNRVLILADDLTGAADCAAAFIGRAARVTMMLEGRRSMRRGVVAIDLDTRSRTEQAACRITRRAFRSRAAKRAAILFKKVDSTLRGHVAAELAAARAALGRERPVVFAPAFPAQGRTTRNGHLYLRGVPLRGAARLPMLDAGSDADLDAIARTLPRMHATTENGILPRPVITVVGSASRVSRLQAAHLSRNSVLGNADLLLQIEWARKPASKDKPVLRRLGRIVAECAPCAHYVLTGGDTARAMLGALGIRELRLLGEVEPGVPFGVARGGTLVCTKAGAFGTARTLLKCVARLKREMKR